MKRPTSEYVALTLAAGLSISIVALVIGVVVAAVEHGNTASSLSENEAAVLTTAFSGIVGVLGSWIGYRTAERHFNGGHEDEPWPDPDQTQPWPAVPKKEEP